MSITSDLLNELFRYEDNKLIWKVSRSGIKAGGVAGTVKPNGYIRVKREHAETSDKSCNPRVYGCFN